MGIGFTLETLKALNSFDINCFVLKVSKHWVSVLSYNYVWPRGPALFATLGVPNAAGFPETCRRASSHACYSTVTPICSVADLSRSNPNKPVSQADVLFVLLHLASTCFGAGAGVDFKVFPMAICSCIVNPPLQ